MWKQQCWATQRARPRAVGAPSARRCRLKVVAGPAEEAGAGAGQAGREGGQAGKAVQAQAGTCVCVWGGGRRRQRTLGAGQHALDGPLQRRLALVLNLAGRGAALCELHPAHCRADGSAGGWGA